MLQSPCAVQQASKSERHRVLQGVGRAHSYSSLALSPHVICAVSVSVALQMRSRKLRMDRPMHQWGAVWRRCMRGAWHRRS